MVRGRRPRTIPAAKSQTKVSVANMKKDCKPMRKTATAATTMKTTATKDATSDSAIETITQRTRNLRKSLHKIQKQFGNQAITKFFQRTLKAHSYPRFGGDSDENACHAFTIEQLNNLGENNNRLMDDGGSDADNANGSSKENVDHGNGSNDDDDDDEEDVDVIGNVDAMTNDEQHNEQNSDATTQIIDSQNSIQPTNIFLQKPVLHLNIDQSVVKQASSIVINKQLDMCPNFATSFYAFNGSVLNTANKGIQSKSSEDESCAEHNDTQSPDAAKPRGEKTNCDKPRLRKRRPRKCASKWADNNASIDAMHDSDSNSCDSGVVSDRSFELSSTDGNKPTTPHRIVCPSTSVPTDEQSPKITQQINLLRNCGVVKRTVKRAKGKQAQNGRTINNAKSYFTKLSAVAAAQAANATTDATKPEDNLNLKAEEAKIDTDCEMPALNIESNDNQNIIKHALPKPTTVSSVSRSATPVQTKQMQSKQMTDFFPVRRSIRKTKKAVELESLRHIEKAIEQQCEDGLVVKFFKEKGRGICAGRPFARGEFVVEYIGDLIEQSEADRREEIYAKDSAFGCYMYYFKHKEQQWCIDATAETGKLGRLVNHSRNGNLVTKIVTYKNRPHLVLMAKENIKEGEELNYDYGDRTRESLVNHPWLAL